MDVIGNNISNVNTTGFKRGRVNFQDLISQSIQGASRPREEVGGINPQQVGLGMQIASIDTIHQQGSLQTTGVSSDVAIQGDGFFVLREGDQEFFTRAGSFGIDANGTLVNPATGLRVQGYAAEVVDGQTIINTAGDVNDLVIPIGSKDSAQATSEVQFRSNLNKTTPEIPADATATEELEGTWSVTKEIYDSFGNTHTLRLDFTRVVGVPNQWEANVTVNPEAEIPVAQDLSVGGVPSADGQSFFVTFSNDGTLLNVANAAGGVASEGELAVNVSFDVPESQIPEDATTAVPGDPTTQSFTLNLGEVGSFTDSMTQFASQSSLKAFEQNGFGMGYLEDYRIDQSGTITGIFSNGTNRALGQIAMASFTNPGGLEKIGETAFRQTINSGEADVGVSGVAGKGSMLAGTLEMSNVDLAEAFTDMITTQRGFQANSRTIQTSDQMLQELLTLKR
jgi:flagellar hook protein FlgE